MVVGKSSSSIMKSLIFFTFICACAALPNPFIADTPEVQAEKQRFYQLYTKAAEAAAAAPDTNVYNGGQKQSHSQYHQASQPQNYNSFPTQTKAFQSYTPNTHHRFSAPQPIQQVQPKWTGPLASDIPAGLPGSVSQVPNTPEVDAAIASFNKVFSAAVRAAPKSTTNQQGHYRQPSHHQGHHYNQATQPHYRHAPQPHYNHAPQPHHNRIPQAQPKWTGPLAATVPAGLPGSVTQVANTPDVEAARAQFGQLYMNQLRSVAG